ncbi:MAG: ATP synthase F0 subunit C [Nitrospirae bacterium]|nr:ATP synthase F0 subunit C [Nitrospirota bacterium]
MKGGFTVKKIIFFLSLSVLLISVTAPLAAAAEAAKTAGQLDYFKTIGVVTPIVIALAAIGGAISQSHAVKGAVEGIARNPGASGKITVAMILGLALIESLVIYTLVVVLILLFMDPFKIL